MKKALLLVALMALAGDAWCVVTGKFDLGKTPSGFFMRDIRNGQWRAGYYGSVWELDNNGMELFHVGFAHTWNAEKGNSAAGINLGKSVTLGQFTNVIAAGFGAANYTPPPFVSYVGNVLSIESNVSYMPIFTPDVRGPWIYGFGAQVNLTDLFGILQKGL